MAPSPHKVDLSRTGCEQLQVAVEIPASDSAVAHIDATLEEDSAWAAYSRRTVRHSLIVVRRGDGDEGGSVHYICHWFMPAPEMPVPPQRGDPWVALDLVYEAATRNKGVHVSAHFNVEGEDARPKLALPITLFEPGAFPFNQIQGYRAALVEDDHTRWSAVIDQDSATGDYQVSIQLDDRELGASKMSRDLFMECVALRDSLMMGQPSV